MNQFFSNCKNVDEIKALYRTLAKEHHPDLGGDEDIFKALGEAYHAALLGQHGTYQTTDETTGKDRNYYYNRQREADCMAKLHELLIAGLVGCEIWLIGTWLWVTGETKEHREALKALKLRWHSKRVAWYWHAPSKRRYSYNAKATLSDLAGRLRSGAVPRGRKRQRSGDDLTYRAQSAAQRFGAGPLFVLRPLATGSRTGAEPRPRPIDN